MLFRSVSQSRYHGLGEGAIPHWELAKKYNLIDFELGVKIAGAGFPVTIMKRDYKELWFNIS